MGDHRREASGQELLNNPLLNRDVAFTYEERKEHGLIGLLPPAKLSIEEQSERAYSQYSKKSTDIGKHIYLSALRNRNETLFYRLLSDHLTEMLPIVYDPTVGEAIKQYSDEYRQARGVYLSVDRPEDIRESFENFEPVGDGVDIVVATDGEGLLGIGDWGVGGMAIAVGKLSIYTAAAGIDPRRTIPVILDAGTNNERLLNEPNYVGNKHSRVSDEEYDEFIEEYVSVVTDMYPEALLHWEDFGVDNARRILETYRDETRSFNDDIQGTGAITLAALLSAVDRTDHTLPESRIVIFGAGTAGIGNADRIRAAIEAEGISESDAYQKFWCIDKQGLLTEDMDDLHEFQRPYARSPESVKDWESEPGDIGLLETIREVQPTTLIGTSTVRGAFDKRIITEMNQHVDRPIIFPLSNPTERTEAVPSDLIKWTDGDALIATGLPYDPVEYDGTTYEIGQANNALVYPGIGLGTTVSRAERVTDGMITAAAEAIVDLIDESGHGAPLLPNVENLRVSSASIAVAVANAAADEEIATAEFDDTIQEVQDTMWMPEYES